MDYCAELTLFRDPGELEERYTSKPQAQEINSLCLSVKSDQAKRTAPGGIQATRLRLALGCCHPASCSKPRTV